MSNLYHVLPPSLYSDFLLLLPTPPPLPPSLSSPSFPHSPSRRFKILYNPNLKRPQNNTKQSDYAVASVNCVVKKLDPMLPDFLQAKVSNVSLEALDLSLPPSIPLSSFKTINLDGKKTIILSSHFHKSPLRSPTPSNALTYTSYFLKNSTLQSLTATALPSKRLSVLKCLSYILKAKKSDGKSIKTIKGLRDLIGSSEIDTDVCEEGVRFGIGYDCVDDIEEIDVGGRFENNNNNNNNNDADKEILEIESTSSDNSSISISLPPPPTPTTHNLQQSSLITVLTILEDIILEVLTLPTFISDLLTLTTDQLILETATNHLHDISETPLTLPQMGSSLLSANAFVTGQYTEVHESRDMWRDRCLELEGELNRVRNMLAVKGESLGSKGTVMNEDSRLSIDIQKFTQNISQINLSKNSRIKKIGSKLEHAVKGLWPRASCVVYGSVKVGLNLPESDVDYVINLPEVHRMSLSRTVGSVDNFDEESVYTVLERKLVQEEWVKTVKSVGRAVKVIKVKTHENVDVDVTFESEKHTGIEGGAFVKKCLEEYPETRVLSLVLKRFLNNRGLLTTYTGGISSYGLFLLITRYCQEQPYSKGMDVGGLLLGFLDFFGNYFDPQRVGVSVREKRYFDRQDTFRQPPLSTLSPLPPPFFPPTTPTTSFERRHSFQDRQDRLNLPRSKSITGEFEQHEENDEEQSEDGSVNTLGAVSVGSVNSGVAVNRGWNGRRLNRGSNFGGIGSPTTQALSGPGGGRGPPRPSQQSLLDNKNATFLDPVWVEDPLSPKNNVLRNAFRIFQVLRAFSDAHRSLQASLEFTVGEQGEMGILGSMLSNEDFFNELITFQK